MTDLEVLDNAIEILGGISVPVSFFDSIGAPVYQVRRNLKLLRDAVTANNKETEPDPPEISEEPAE